MSAGIMEKPKVRTLVIPPTLYERAVRAASREGAERGETVSVSEWVREAIRQRLERDE